MRAKLENITLWLYHEDLVNIFQGNFGAYIRDIFKRYNI